MRFPSIVISQTQLLIPKTGKGELYPSCNFEISPTWSEVTSLRNRFLDQII